MQTVVLANGHPDSDPSDLRGYVELALRGGFPEPALELDGVARREWLASYVGQLLVHERAVGGSAPDPSQLGAYFAAYALNSAGVVDDTTLATAAGIDRRTAQSYASLLAEAPFDPLRPRWHHLRERDGRREVDLMADLGARGIVGIEVKAHSAPKRDHARHLMWLRDTMGERFVAGAVLHTGPDRSTLADRIEAIPICALWD